MLAEVMVAAALAAGPAAPLISVEREQMATRVTISVAPGARTETEVKDAIRRALAELDRVEQVMNEWRPGSELSRINAQAGAERPVPSPEDLCRVIERSLDAAKRTAGLFDPTWAALRGVWRFGTGADGGVPAEREIQRACGLVRWGDVTVLRKDAGEGCSVRLHRPGMQLGLGGVAKGWAVDRAVASLRADGLRDFFVQVGGDLYAAGKRGDRPWQVGIRDPRGPPESHFAQMEVTDAAFSTSGDYERFFIAGGKRYHHLIDPRTCRPATASRSATVLARTAVDAELLTKAVFILGGQEGLKLAESWGAAAVLITADNRVLASPSLEGKLQSRTPTP